MAVPPRMPNRFSPLPQKLRNLRSLPLTTPLPNRRLSALTRLLLQGVGGLLLLLTQTGCFARLNSYQLDLGKSSSVPCRSIHIPEEWHFPGDLGHSDASNASFTVRLGQGESGVVLLAGVRSQDDTIIYSKERYRIRLRESNVPVLVSDEDWERAVPVALVRRPVDPDAFGHEMIPPKVDFAGRTYTLSGSVFWDAPELTRLSTNGRWLLGISYRHGQGLLRPRSWAHFDVFSTKTGERIWSAVGEGPSLTPFTQFAAVAWLDDSILLMPHNSVGSWIDACLFDPARGAS